MVAGPGQTTGIFLETSRSEFFQDIAFMAIIERCFLEKQKKGGLNG
jgi:hypothetical protein